MVFIEPGQFVVEGRIYPEELTFRLGYAKINALKQDNFEASVDYLPGKDSVVDLIQLLFEASSSMMESHFADAELEFPKKWQNFTVNDKTVYMKYSTVNSALENAADALLGVSGNGLINEELVEDSDALGKTANVH